ncbi:MAG TPA: type II toxin-antitoxin system RelE/ParE family toxin [Geobacterales bacterium]|nr:type II toxin-antitoxin system RelE/ParE family toxin [Geobacterales bacterium]
MRVHWTETALGHLDALHRYIAQDSPEYARQMVDRLIRRSQQIADFLLSDRTVPEYAMNNLRQIIEGPYRIIYLIKTEQIDIIAVIHGRMDILRSSEREEV